ncbi:Methyltransferase type 11 [Lutibaculum baratangense AMV1]|uniref:Methyltransferase type 11 n=1 Tax=Lutibaculum baratangense AMV1 TaxID=631454 RepID=V4RJD7_9HYPH|nr:Methyltransferase type 11 [Lutibaculum baratangense AMV1]
MRMQQRPVGRRLSLATRWRTKLVPRREIEQLAAGLVPPGPILDIGCGSGMRGRRLPPGYVPYGIEVSAASSAVADREFGARGGACIHAPATEGLARFENGFFRGAILRSYLEHETQPREVLRELMRTLRPGGVAVVKVPNFASLNRRLAGRSWCGFRFPDHVNYFTPSALRTMAERAGFEVGWRRFGRLPTSDNMWAYLRRPPE